MVTTNLNFLVTGGNGYIGSHMCKLLHQNGHQVHIIDNFVTSPQKATHSYGTFHRLDIADQERVGALLQKISFEGIFHFAARALVSEGEKSPFLYYQDNVVKTLSLLETCAQFNLKKFIFSSTCASFGIPQKEKIAEDHPQKPINTYGNSKLILELVMQDLADKGLIDFVILRYFNVAGCSPDGEIGENHDPETHLIPNLCRAYLESNVKFKIFGDKYPTPDGSCIRDYIHVEDLVRAHLLAFNYAEKNRGLHHFNLGSEDGHSVKEVMGAFSQVTDEQLDVDVCPPRPGDPTKLVADSSKIKEKLNFTPNYSLRDCIKHTLNYLKG